MPVIDALGENKASAAHRDTWGHLYPKPSTKYAGEMVIAIGCYGNLVIISTNFERLEPSIHRYNLEHSIFNKFELGPGVYRVSCTLWFFKDPSYGKIIKCSIKEMY